MTEKINFDTLKSQHILKLTAEEKRAWLDSFDVVLFDCDGCIWSLIEPIPNTGPAINLLKNFGKQCKFVSNNSMRTDEKYQQKLASIGIVNVHVNDIIHPVKIISRYINDQIPGQTVFSLCSPIMNDVFRQNGVDIKILEPDVNIAMEDIYEKISPNPNEKIAAVVLDINFNLTFNQLARAICHLKNNKNCHFLVGATDALIPITKNLTTIGNAGFMRIIEESSGKTPIVLGKPGPMLGKYLIENFNLKRTIRTLFVGDNLETDTGFGISCGFQTLLVLSGATKYEALLQRPLKEQPDFYADSVADFIEFFKNLSK